ncbi:MAG: hypothetical protein QW449_03795 [Candidatus Aenigmatarchaeota archaeon]
MLAKLLAELNEEPKGDRIKKVFISKNGTIKFDEKRLEQYGDDGSGPAKELVKDLDIPLFSKSGLENKNTNSSQTPIYIIISVNFDGKKGKLLFTLPLKSGKLSAKFKLESEKLDYPEENGDFEIKLDSKANYLVGNERLYDLYLKNGIIKKGNKIHSDLFKKVVKEFINKYKEHFKDKSSSLSFKLYLLPDQAESINVHYEKDKKETKEASSTLVSDTRSTVLSNAKFMSAIDPPFTLNLQESMANFKRMIGFSDAEFEKVTLVREHKIKGDLYWKFFSGRKNLLANYNKRVVGFYGFLESVYERIKRTEDIKEQGSINILCFKQENQKITMLISENMSFKRFKDLGKRIFDEIKLDGEENDDIFEEAFLPSEEVYIDKIKALIYNLPVSKQELIAFFMSKLKDGLEDGKIRLFSAINDSAQSEVIFKYFKRTYNCIKLLCRENMDEAQEFALKIGQIAGHYIKWRKNNEGYNNSLNSILQYNKYDINQLRFVFEQVCRGVALSNIDDKKKEEINEYIKEHLPKEIDGKIGDNRNDLAYFFYKGVFEELGREEKSEKNKLQESKLEYGNK